MQVRRNQSVIWSITSNEFAKLISNSKSVSEVLRYLGLGTKGNNTITLKKRCIAEGIDIDKLLQKGRMIGRSNLGTPVIPLVSILVTNSDYSRGHLKQRLVSEGLLINECEICKIGQLWHGKPLILQLDHRNGVPNDNRLENLRLICPNCHSQTPTFTGRSRK